MAMELYHLACLITVPKASSKSKQSFSILLNLIDIMFELIFSRFDNVQKFFSRFWFSLRLQFCLGNSKVFEEESESQESDLSHLQRCSDKEKDDANNICRQEIEMVMASLGLVCSPGSEELKEEISSDEFSHLFAEKEPSLEEIKEAFNVFDQNKDGFIDVMELQIVCTKLGLKEGRELENCTTMIRKFDENGDGRIDFKEFVRLMENSFC